MFKKTACKITQRLCEKGIISESDFDLYEYGFNMRITVLLNLISTIVIGVIAGKVFESIAFLVFYIPLRSYAGGYHASTPRRCYFIENFHTYYVGMNRIWVHNECNLPTKRFKNFVKRVNHRDGSVSITKK